MASTVHRSCNEGSRQGLFVVVDGDRVCIYETVGLRDARLCLSLDDDMAERLSRDLAEARGEL